MQRVARSTGALCGVLVLLFGAWGALVPFIGPYFGDSFGSTATWHYTSDRLVLDVLPGAAAFVGGLLILSAASRFAGVAGSWVAVVAGVWLPWARRSAGSG